MNKIFLMGRLVKDPEARMSQSGKPVTKFTMAVDRPYNKNGEDKADFLNCVAFGKTAEIIGNNVNKGNKLLVEGRVQVDSYTGKDGQKKFFTSVIVDRMEFVESKKSQSKPARKISAADVFGSEVSFDEEVPF